MDVMALRQWNTPHVHAVILSEYKNNSSNEQDQGGKLCISAFYYNVAFLDEGIYTYATSIK